MLRVHQGVGERAVIGQKQKPLGIHVQPPDGVHTHAAVRHKTGHVRPSLLVGQSRYIATGLIQ